MIRTLEGLCRIDLYTTRKTKKLLASEVRKATGADVVINGTLFDYGRWAPLCVVKQHGKMLVNDGYTYRGLAWNDGDDHFTVAVSGDLPKWDNFISCVFLINGGKLLPIQVDAAVGGYSSRTAIYGTQDGKTNVWCSKAAMKPDELARNLLQLGAQWALMLDGGGSSQLSQEGEQYVYTERRVQNYICFWLEETDNEPEGERPMVEINAYSKSKDGEKRLSSHFKVKEFACHSGADAVLVAPRLVMVLEGIRTHFGKAVSIHSGYRTPEYNESKKVGGKPRSQHTYGTAADISVRGETPQAVADYARQLMPDWGGVGVYKTFTHVDVREARADWRGN